MYKVLFLSTDQKITSRKILSYTPQIKCFCIIADDFLTWFVWFVLNKGFTRFVVSVENDAWSTHNVLFEQLINVFIL